MPTRIVYGRGVVAQVGDVAGELGAGRVLLVTDRGLVEAGHVAGAEAVLSAAGLEVARFDETRENPTGVDVQACLAVARKARPDVLVGLGGGSSIDVAKGANLLYTNGGEIEDYKGKRRWSEPLLPLVAVPTTAGTGSEVQSFTLIARKDTHEKMACGDPELAPRVALLDPELTLSQPQAVTACTGLDAIGHAVETAVTKARNDDSDARALEAFRLASGAFPRVLQDPEDLDARGDMLRAASEAGLAIEGSMLGAAHALANPLTARFGVAHGHAVALMLPHVVRFNAKEPDVAERYRELAAAAGFDLGSGAACAEWLASWLQGVTAMAGLPANLTAAGIAEDAYEALADDAAGQWTAGFNPRPVTRDDLLALYAAAQG